MNPPPLVPIILMASCEATGPCAMVWVPPSTVVDLGVGVEILNHSGGAKIQSSDDGERQQHVESGAGHVHPKVADRFRLLAGEAANYGDGDRDTHGGRGEVIHSQRNHLREVTHGRFARVRLPVGVAQES